MLICGRDEVKAGGSGREFLEDLAFGFHTEELGGEPADDGDDGEEHEHVLDADAGDDETDQDRAQRGSGAEPGGAEPGADGPEPGRVELGGVQVQGERDGLQDGVGDGGADQDLHGGGGTEHGQGDQRDDREQERGVVPAFPADLVDQQGAGHGGQHTERGGGPPVEQAGLQGDVEHLGVQGGQPGDHAVVDGVDGDPQDPDHQGAFEVDALEQLPPVRLLGGLRVDRADHGFGQRFAFLDRFVLQHGDDLLGLAEPALGGEPAGGFG